MFKDFRSIFMPIFKVFRGTKSVEIPNSQVSFHFKGILMEDKVTTNRISQLGPRKSNDKNNYLEILCYGSKNYQFLVEQLHFKSHIRVMFRTSSIYIVYQRFLRVPYKIRTQYVCQ